MSLQTNEILKFADFEVDPTSRSVRRHGERLPLNRRSFDILLLFVRHPGQIISREELIKQVWPDTFVDENTLSQSISTLRKSLSERPGDNSFIATLPGRGYQFVAPVTEIPSPHSSATTQSEALPQATLLEDRTLRTQIVTVHDEQTFTETRSRGRTWVLAFVVLLIAAGAGWWVHESRLPQLYPHIETVIADLDNTTGDADFDHTLNKVLQIDLQQSPYFSVISDGRAHRTLKLMGQPADERLTDQLAREVCQRLNGQVYLAPGIAKLGSEYLLTLQANDCHDGHPLSEQRKEVTKKGDVLEAFSGMISLARHDVGETRASLKEFDKPFYEEKTSSLEALKAYSEAERLGNAGKYTEAVSLLKHAIQLDPQFAIAYGDLSSFCYQLDDMNCSKDAMTKAYTLRDTVNERERFYLEYRYAQSITGDLHAITDTLQQWSAMYPEDNLPLGALVNQETWTGRYAQAAADAQHLQDLELRQQILNGLTAEMAARAYFHANMPDKFREAYANAVQKKFDDVGIHQLMLMFASDNGDQNGVDKQIAWARGTPNEAHLMQYAALAAMESGQVKKAETYFAQSTAAAKRDNLTASMSDLDDYHLRMLTELGLNDQAHMLLATLPPSDPTLDKAFGEAVLGLDQQSLAEAKKQLADAPTDTLMAVEYVPSVRAEIALRNGKPDEAIRLLQADAPYEMRDPTVPYLRGQVFLAAHRGKEAEAEFEKIAEKPWIADPPAPVIELAELQLARSFAQQGFKEKAITAYQRFLSAWAKADSSLPVLAEGKTELARLTTVTKP